MSLLSLFSSRPVQADTPISSPLNNAYLLPKKYNSLPYILDNEAVPSQHHKDIEDLRSLFRKHSVPNGVRVKLVHKHFDIEAGEVMVHREIGVSTEGAVSIMGPMETKRRIPLTGLNYMVDEMEQLQCYEYIIAEQPNISQHLAFLEEFRTFIILRGLQRKLGLRIGQPDNPRGWTEFEVADRRGTIMIPNRFELPRVEDEHSVTTELEADRAFDSSCSSHCKNHHICYSYQVCIGHKPSIEPPKGDDPTACRTNDWFLAGTRLIVGSPLQLVVSTAISKL